MEARALLLANTFFIILLSSISENWLLYKVRQHTPIPSLCHKHTSVHGISYLQCGNESHVLIEQRTSLFRLCNDLTDKTRKNVSRHRLLYKEACHWILGDPWSPWRPASVPYWEFLLSAILSLCAFGNLSYAAQQAIQGKDKGAGHGASACTALFTLALLTQLHIMHSVNTNAPRDGSESLRYCEAGWSLLSGCLGTTLSGICGYLYMSAAQLRADRERSQKRRRLMQNAIMSSCRQEIALAIRAKMTVL